MKRKVSEICKRVQKRKAVGILYNIPKLDANLLHNRLLDEKQIVINGSDAYTANMLLYRLGHIVGIKNLSFKQIPGAVIDKMIVINGADIVKNSYTRVLEEMYKGKIPLLLLLHTESSIKEIRKLPAYNKILTIEQDYAHL